jgi:hypothetical protein
MVWVSATHRFGLWTISLRQNNSADKLGSFPQRQNTQQNRERTPVHMYVCMDYVDNPTTLKNLQISKSVGDSDMARRMIGSERSQCTGSHTFSPGIVCALHFTSRRLQIHLLCHCAMLSAYLWNRSIHFYTSNTSRNPPSNFLSPLLQHTSGKPD